VTRFFAFARFAFLLLVLVAAAAATIIIIALWPLLRLADAAAEALSVSSVVSFLLLRKTQQTNNGYRSKSQEGKWREKRISIPICLLYKELRNWKRKQV